jgi:hypothetical protein
MKTSFALAALAAVLASCASDHTPHVRFANAPAVTAVDDRRDVKTEPAPRPFARTLYHLRGNFIRRVERGMEVNRPRRALGINALDEVPDSTWFTNRIGARDMTADEIRRGPGDVGNPDLHLPWTIKSTKVGGKSIGFIIKDSRGEKWVLKFDGIGVSEVETGPDAISSRLLWAAGFNTPEDHVVYFRPEDLVLAKDAKVKDVFGGERSLDRAALDRLLGKVGHQADGRIRGLASRFLDGTWLGGHLVEGTRPDDPNDRIPHELRRDLRGAQALYAWLDHGDIKEDNFLDMWVTDPADPSRHYIKHYLIDLGLTLGAMGATAFDPRRSFSYAFDATEMVASLASAGAAIRPWESRIDPHVPGVGWFAVDDFDPGSWKPYTPTYLPSQMADRRDNFWGAKILMRFTREQLAAAIETARYSDPRAAAYVLDVLVARQRKTGRYWFERTNPLDRFAMHGSSVCFDDLLLTYGLQAPGAKTYYQVTVTDRAGVRLGQRDNARVPIAASANGSTCTPFLALSRERDGYSIIQLRTRRAGFDMSTYVHVARNAAGTLRVIGIWRQ